MSYENHAATEEVLARLERWRTQQIAVGREVAVRLCLDHGTTNTREVWEYMKAEGTLDERIQPFWLGTVFRGDKRFVKTGRDVQPPLSEGVPTHSQHKVKEWRLRDGKEFPVKTQTKERVRISEDESPKNGRDKESQEVWKLATSLLTDYRPKKFESVIGQDVAIKALEAALKVHHAVIISGMSGVGKTTVARLAARIWLRATRRNILEVDAARFNGVDAMEQIASMLDHNPLLREGPLVFIIDECHRITQNGWTLLLKSIEDSPQGVYWFFCTTDLKKVPETGIRSQRCTVIQLQPVAVDVILRDLEEIAELEGFETPRDVLKLCARQSLGSPRRALSHLASCYHCKTYDEALEILNVVDPEAPSSELGYEIAKGLKSPNPAEIQAMARKAEEAKESPEGVRAVIRGYYKTVWYNAKDKQTRRRCREVLRNFEEPVNDFASLVVALDMCLGDE